MSYFNLAMDLSSGMFAYHICGVMTACSEAGSICPAPEAEALSSLETFHSDALVGFNAIKAEEPDLEFTISKE